MKRLRILFAALAITCAAVVASGSNPFSTVDAQTVVPISGLPTAPAAAPADIVPCVHSGTTSQCSMTQIWTPAGPIVFVGAGVVGTGAQTYCAQDAGATAGIVCNVPSSSTYAYRWQVNNTTIAQINATGGFLGAGLYALSGAAIIVPSSSTNTIITPVASGGVVYINNYAGSQHNVTVADATGNTTVRGTLTVSGASLTLPQSVAITNALASPNIFYFGTSGQGTYFDLYRPTSGATDIDTSGASVNGISGTALAIQTLGGSALFAFDTSGNLASLAAMTATAFKVGTASYGQNTLNGSTFFPYAISSFTSSGTFTTPSDGTTSTVYRYRMVGGGGGGGGAVTATFSAAGGGGSGAYAEGYFSGVAASTGITVTVGAAGTAGTTAGAAGGSGGSSSIGSPVSVTCGGGSGGGGSTNTTSALVAGGAGGTLTSGSPTISFAGQKGHSGITFTSGQSSAGDGAGDSFGPGGLNGGWGGTFSGPGNAGVFPGVGGGGGVGTSGSGFVGGAGTAGIVIIERMTP